MALAMCRAFKVLCVAEDEGALRELRTASVSAEWELTQGAISVADAVALIEAERPHVLVAFGSFADLTRLAKERFPGMRIVADRELPGADAVVGDASEVRDAVKGRPRARGPVR
jgi:hypothetical protein